MTIPEENAIAAYPPSVKAGNVTLRPLTLGGAIRISSLGVDIGKPVDKDALFRVAAVLAGEDDTKRFLKRSRVGLNALSSAVETVLNTAFTTYVKPAQGERKTTHFTPHGLGWPLEYAEWLCHEYGWSWQAALDTPLATVYALEAACRARNGGRHAGLDYIERQYRKDVKSGKAQPFRIG